MCKILFFLSIILVSLPSYSADQDQISKHFNTDYNSRPETKTLELELTGTLSVHNKSTEPMWVRVSGINLWEHTGFDYDEAGKQTVLFNSIWSSKLKYIQPGESKEISYLFLKTWFCDQKILTKPVLHYCFSSNGISQGHIPFDLYANSGPVMKATLPDSTNASTPMPEIISVKPQCDYKKIACDLLAKHIQFVRAHCHYHRDVIRVLEQCHASNGLSAPELGTIMLKHLDAQSPRNTRVNE